jgi:hypothetical protein
MSPDLDPTALLDPRAMPKEVKRKAFLSRPCVRSDDFLGLLFSRYRKGLLAIEHVARL